MAEGAKLSSITHNTYNLVFVKFVDYKTLHYKTRRFYFQSGYYLQCLNT